MYYNGDFNISEMIVELSEKQTPGVAIKHTG